MLGPATNGALFGHQAAITPDRLQERVVSAVIIVAMSLSTAAPLVSGILISRFGSAAAIFVFVAVVGLSAVAASAEPSPRRHRRWTRRSPHTRG